MHAHQHSNRQRHTRYSWEGLAGMGVSSAVSNVGRTSNAFKVTMKLQTFLFQMLVTSRISVQYLWKYGFAKSSDNLDAPCIVVSDWNKCIIFFQSANILILFRALWSEMNWCCRYSWYSNFSTWASRMTAKTTSSTFSLLIQRSNPESRRSAAP